MFRFFRLAVGVMFRLFRRRGSLVLENLVLRQQVSVLKRKNRRPRLAGMDRWFWVAVRQVWPGWKASLLLLDHVIPVSERHLRRLVSDHVDYYHDDRTHLGLDKQTPNGRTRSGSDGMVISSLRIGGLHHRYERAA